MADFTLVEPKGWEYDLHSVYSAYLGYFQVYNIAWYERSWGHLFESFEDFLAFSWPVITVTDATTGRPHIVTRLNSVGAFLKMIKTRFGETLVQAPNILQVIPFETSTRHLRNVSDYASYKKLYSTLPAVALSATKHRVKTGEPKSIREIWEKRDKTYLAMSFEWNERNERTVLEWGYAAVRCAHLEALAQWPPIPDTNYRKGHYIVAEHVDTIANKHRPTHPFQYAFGDSQLVPKAKLPQIIQAVISSLASPDTETAPNALVLVGHNLQGSLARLEEMKIRLPHNMLTIDTMVYERALYANGHRGVMQDPRSNSPRINGSSLSFENLLYSLTLPSAPNVPVSSGSGSSGDRDRDKTSPSHRESTPSSQTHTPLVLPQYAPHNSGNDAMMCLFALQHLLEPVGTHVPSTKKGAGKGNGQPMMMAVPMPVSMMPMAPMGMSMPMMNMSMNMGMGGMGMGGMGMGLGIPGAMGVPGAMGMGAAASVPFPQGTGTPPLRSSSSSLRPSMGRPRPTTVYDLASEFGQMQMENRSPGTGGSSLRSPTSGSYGYSSNSLRPPMGSGSKRIHSFPNQKTEALE